jgi:hypothetical protein
MLTRARANQLIREGHANTRRMVRKVGASLARALPSLLLPSGWAFLTWSMFLWSPRAWAASVGLFLVLSGLAPVVATYLAAKAAARRNVDR